jgi:hypothetical protein
MQRFARWIPTSEEDRRRAAEIADRAERVSVDISGRKAGLPADLLPIQLGNLRGHDVAYLTMLHESALSDEARTALRHGRIAAMFQEGELGSDRYYLLGYLSASDKAGINDDDSLLLACSRDDGALYLEHPETGRGLFYGYFEKLERIFRKAEKAVTEA